ncbi:aromatase/cyclase [Streptomyces sp. NRRL WC-3549]|uniref:aromatase/cyclase n=1 Tax=Streptomyces sp. NRRL WC-3549 TaxID=1463925 RepID=UPI0004CB8EE2|nr:aromatase/cyclase [Streptomyces sp. NRRL WC-3549]
MSALKRHRAEHSLVVSAPAAQLYAVIADVTLWPAVFGPTVHVRHLERGERAERFEIWATVGDGISRWTSCRTLDPAGLRVTFRQDHSRPPVASMEGEWALRELPGGDTEVVLLHDFTVVDDDPEAVASVNAALDRNSEAELAALARVAGRGYPVADLVFSFTDRLEHTGPAAEAYGFVRRAELWAERLPHVERVRLTEDAPGIQDLEMDTVTADGSRHTTGSVRVCRDPEWIAYKQRVTPALLAGHSGLWTFSDGPDGPVATARHTVALDPDGLETVLGSGATVADGRAYVREALGRNSLATLTRAAEHARTAVGRP